jgi:chaperone BCS1
MIKSKKQLDSIFFEQQYNVNNEKTGITFDKKIIVFEDIDCIGDIVLAREFRKPEPQFFLPQIITDVKPICGTEKPIEVSKIKMEDPVTLDDLLNLWDGIRETPGRIMILSSNHYDKLDPAIKRPGRIDIALELSYASRNTVKEMHRHFFGTEIDEVVLDKINNHFYSPAELVNIYMTEERNENKFLERLMKNEHVI